MKLRRPRTLRARLVAVLLACLLFCCAVVAVVTSFALHGFLLDRLDQQLAQASNRYAANLENATIGDRDSDDAIFGSSVGQSAGTLGARVHAGAVVALGVIGDGDGDNDDDQLPDAQARAVIARQQAGGPRTVHLPHLGEYRITVAHGRNGDLLVTGLPEHPVEETIGRLLLIELLVFAVAIALAGVVAAVLVRLSLRPLNRVASTAQAVSELPLSSGEVALPDPVENPSAHTEAGRLARAFNRMLEHVQAGLTERHAGEERLRRFVADASHELRTPVAVVRSHAEFVQRSHEVSDPAALRALARIVAESDRMGAIVEDLLTLARLDEGRELAAEPVDLARVALEAVEDARAAAPDHQWRLELPDEPGNVRGDAHGLHQVVANLLTNTREHTPPGTTVTVAVRPGVERTVLEVHDDGPGIPSELQEQLFQRFVRGRTATGRGGGAGLGLAIVSALVRAMGGSVQVDSEPGNTNFRVDLATATGNRVDLRSSPTDS
jgi:two-component system OmpR family sensor kinase